MSGFINYDLMNDIERVVDAGVIQEVTSDPSFDERHLSELSRIVTAMDEKEIYTVIKAIVKSHRETLVKTLEDIEKEGVANERDNSI